jgi:carboxymethylenebutenolidase
MCKVPEAYTAAQQRMIDTWEEHMRAEFAAKSVKETMDTMPAKDSHEAENIFVNHVPTMTGGCGHPAVVEFYTNHFLEQMPEDTETEMVSRTVGSTQIVDEMIFKFTFSSSMEWMLPGLTPNNKRVEVPLVAIIGFNDQVQVCFERIYWDQASVLVQLGLIDGANLPVAGIEQTKKVQDHTLPSNTLIHRSK